MTAAPAVDRRRHARSDWLLALAVLGAAALVRLLMAEGTPLLLTALPEAHQARLAEQMAQMGLVDRATMAAVVEDFLAGLEAAVLEGGHQGDEEGNAAGALDVAAAQVHGLGHDVLLCQERSEANLVLYGLEIFEGAI